jgi:uncharacterized protein (DUF488 family)
MQVQAAGIVGTGYEGTDLDSFISYLTEQRISVLADVRLTPISRKRGFSKRALAEALAAAGISYLHLRSLGNPKVNRAGFSGDDEQLLDARHRYATLLNQEAALAALDELAEHAQHQRVAVMCFEADESRCHRHVVLTEVRSRLTPA